ncbi:hypothetical protein QYF61_009636 [Mycteria americana]|uniref:Uncharacterized protein n=1 Tax=Mycteria americana TaxID=33587 RepID=A0AAN7S0R8_MYCAM|nr:hypothetical protein QYF61_009636 [Mycteria americana]
MDLGFLVNNKLDMSRQGTLPAKKANSTLVCIRGSVTRRLGDVILPLYEGRHIWSTRSSSGFASESKRCGHTGVSPVKGCEELGQAGSGKGQWSVSRERVEKTEDP